MHELIGVLQFKIIEENAEKTLFIPKALMEEHGSKLIEHCTKHQASGETPIELANVDIVTFDSFVSSLGGITIRSIMALTSRQEDHSWSRAMRFIKAYIFATTYDLPLLLQIATSCLRGCLDWSLECEAQFREASNGDWTSYQTVTNLRLDFLHEVTYVYAHTTSTSPLRCILVDGFCASTFEAQLTPNALAQYPKDFLVDVLPRRSTLAGYEESVKDARACVGRRFIEGDATQRSSKADKKRKEVAAGMK